MPDQKQSPSASFRRNLYWTEDMESKVKRVAEKLHRAGVLGMFNSNGEPNRSAVIRYLLDKELANKK